MFDETVRLLPLLMSENSEALLKEEKVNNNLLLINAESSRFRAIREIKRRFNAVDRSFWEDFVAMDEKDKLIALFFVILKTYKICFDFHVHVTMRKWNSVSKCVEKDDLMMEFNEISSKDAFVDTWSDNTKDRISSGYLTILRRVGMLDRENQLRALTSGNFDYYLMKGEPWFLEACLLQPYEIENIKKKAYDDRRIV